MIHPASRINTNSEIVALLEGWKKWQANNSGYGEKAFLGTPWHQQSEKVFKYFFYFSFVLIAQVEMEALWQHHHC